jgi:hypothetical protein
MSFRDDNMFLRSLLHLLNHEVRSHRPQLQASKGAARPALMLIGPMSLER